MRGAANGGVDCHATTLAPQTRPMLDGGSFLQGTTLSSQASPALDVARLFIILPATNFFLQPTSHDQLAESTDRFLDRLAISNVNLNHIASLGKKPAKMYCRPWPDILQLISAKLVCFNDLCNRRCFTETH